MAPENKIRVGRYLIYGLLDPETQELRYIGKTHKRREWRLAEHITLAKEGDSRPVYEWIRELLRRNLSPSIFVLRRIPPDRNWRKAEQEEINRWKSLDEYVFPVHYPPQTPKSSMVVIKGVKLLNVTKGG